MFNIITTNKNNTAIAPMYIIKNNIPKNSTPNNIKSPAELKNNKTKKNIQYIVFFDKITKIEKTKINNEKNMKKKKSLNI